MTALSLDWDPLVPLWLIGLLGGLALVLGGLAIVRGARGGWLRLALFAVLVLALANPSGRREERRPAGDVAALVVDRSPSQAIGARAGRTEAALAALAEAAARQEGLELRVVEAGRLDDEAAAPGGSAVSETRLIGPLVRALADVPRERIAGAIILTDGQVHDLPAALGPLAELAPLHVLLTGERDESDRVLRVLDLPAYGIVGKTLTARLQVDAHGGAEAGPMTITVTRADGATERFAARPGAPFQVTLPIDHAGANVTEVAVNAVPGELTPANNRAALVVNGVRDRLNVLLVSGEPHNGERTWRNILKSDPAVSLVHFTILRPPEKSDGVPVNELALIPFPVRELFEEQLSEFDLIIFDRYRRRGVLPPEYFGNIARYVQDGGAFLEASGPSFAGPASVADTALADILAALPAGGVIDRPYRPEVTATGRRHPVTGELPGLGAGGPPDWGRWFHQIPTRQGRGTTLMTGIDGLPLLMLDRIGQGRLAQLTSDNLWLWSRGFEGGGPQAELLRRLAHWLMGEPELEENALRARVEGARVTVERRTLEPDASPVSVTAPSGATEALALEEGAGGWARASFTAEELGLHQLGDGRLSAWAVVGTVDPPELREVRTTPERLAPAVAAARGSVTWLADLSGPAPVLRRVGPGALSAGQGWIGLTDTGATVTTGVTRVPLMPAVLLLVLALSTAALAWWREGR